jgi:excisionase family DNA binding protein
MSRTRALFPIALSIESAAKSLQIPTRVVREAVASGAVRAFVAPSGKRVRILVADLTRWIIAYWQPKQIKRQLEKVANESPK